jgi:hypothetical protein
MLRNKFEKYHTDKTWEAYRKQRNLDQNQCCSFGAFFLIRSMLGWLFSSKIIPLPILFATFIKKKELKVSHTSFYHLKAQVVPLHKKKISFRQKKLSSCQYSANNFKNL